MALLIVQQDYHQDDNDHLIIIHYLDHEDHNLMLIHNHQLTICLYCREEIEDVAQSVHDLMGRRVIIFQLLHFV